MIVGIEAINAYVGRAYIDVRELFEARELDLGRIDNLMMLKKTIGCPWEDAVSFGVNAAKPLIDNLSDNDKSKIEMVITASESGVDFGKSLSTYIHDHLGLGRNCRLFEIKQACYGGTAALQMAVNHIAANLSPGAKVLVIATDAARATARHSYAEPSQAVASVAMLISDKAQVMAVDQGAFGLYSYEVMDTCRPTAELETGYADLSLLSYLDCLTGAFSDYTSRVENVDLMSSFDYLVFHAPFGGMVKGAHRKLLREVCQASAEDIESDFVRRVAPSLKNCSEIGNAYSASAYLGLISTIVHSQISNPQRVGVFSYGSGCSSEFFSGVLNPQAEKAIGAPQQQLAERAKLSISEYDNMVDESEEWKFGLKDKKRELGQFESFYQQQFEGRGLLILDEIKDFHRKYLWS